MAYDRLTAAVDVEVEIRHRIEEFSDPTIGLLVHQHQLGDTSEAQAFLHLFDLFLSPNTSGPLKLRRMLAHLPLLLPKRIEGGDDPIRLDALDLLVDRVQVRDEIVAARRLHETFDCLTEIVHWTVF